MFYSHVYNSPVGLLKIVENRGFIVNIIFENSLCNNFNTVEKETDIIKETFCQLDEYFNGKRKFFSIPIKTHGSDFQEKVWEFLKRIPYGKTMTYKEVAAAVNCHKGFRAVGLANNKNPIPIILPCHRVIGTNGKLIGYAGGLDTKKFLLNLERAKSNSTDKLF
jgi:methylated-DNA-[protein]-cysteine S-methyltransferase